MELLNSFSGMFHSSFTSCSSPRRKLCAGEETIVSLYDGDKLMTNKSRGRSAAGILISCSVVVSGGEATSPFPLVQQQQHKLSLNVKLRPLQLGHYVK